MAKYRLHSSAAALLSVAFAFWPVNGTARASEKVEQLRRVIQRPAFDLSQRKSAVERQIEAIQTIGEIAEALVLCEWRDCDVDHGVAALDRELRGTLRVRFEKLVRNIMSDGEPLAKIAVFGLLERINKNAGGIGGGITIGQMFGADIARHTQNPDFRVRESATSALGHICTDAEIFTPPLKLLLGSTDERDRRSAVLALKHIAANTSIAFTRVRRSTSSQRSNVDSLQLPRSVLALAAIGLNDAQPASRAASAAVMGDSAAAISKSMANTEPGIEDDPPMTVETNAIMSQKAILIFQEPIQELSARLQDSDQAVRSQAGKSLEEIARLRLHVMSHADSHRLQTHDGLGDGFERAMPMLIQALLSRDEMLRVSVLTILELLGSKAANAGMTIAECCRDRNRFVRWSAARCFRKMAPKGADAALPALVGLASDSEIDVRLAAVTALGSYGSAARASTPALLQLLTCREAVEVRLASLRALEQIGEVGTTELVTALLCALTDSDARLRLLAAQQLGRLGPAARSAIEPLQRASADAHPAVKNAADEALLRIIPGRW